MGKDLWKAIALMLGVLAVLGSAEWFVTYCVFSDFCPLVVTIADGVAL
jgi:hypothetical protein